MRPLVLLGFLILSIAALEAQGWLDNDESSGPLSSRKSYLDVLCDREIRFSRKVIKEVAKRDRKNFVISTLSTMLTLTMASIGGRRYTTHVFRHAFGFPRSLYPRKSAFRIIIDQLDSYKTAELYLANGLFLTSGVRADSEFTESISTAFRSPVQQINFTKSAEASNSINNWCETKTNSHIKEVVKPTDLNARTSILLVNAVYFKGSWLKKFDSSKTRKVPFFLEDGTQKKVPSMFGKQTLRFGNYPEVNASFIELPLLGENSTHIMSMFIILPTEKTGLANLEKHFSKIVINDLFTRGKPRNINIQLPKLNIENNLRLGNVLSNMEMDTIFDSTTADFSGILEFGDPTSHDWYYKPNYPPGFRRLYISRMIQQAVINIDEEGSENGNEDFIALPPNATQPLDFIADHPFYVIIVTPGESPLNILTARFTGSD